jgi:hypothetical protein
MSIAPQGRIVLVLVAVVVLGVAIAFFSSFATVPQSEIGFAVGGGPLDPARAKVKGDMLRPGRTSPARSTGCGRFRPTPRCGFRTSM